MTVSYNHSNSFQSQSQSPSIAINHQNIQRKPILPNTHTPSSRRFHSSRQFHSIQFHSIQFHFIPDRNGSHQSKSDRIGSDRIESNRIESANLPQPKSKTQHSLFQSNNSTVLHPSTTSIHRLNTRHTVEIDQPATLQLHYPLRSDQIRSDQTKRTHTTPRHATPHHCLGILSHLIAATTNLARHLTKSSSTSQLFICSSSLSTTNNQPRTILTMMTLTHDQAVFPVPTASSAIPE